MDTYLNTAWNLETQVSLTACLWTGGGRAVWLGRTLYVNSHAKRGVGAVTDFTIDFI